jgi:hypothetical protein
MSKSQTTKPPTMAETLERFAAAIKEMARLERKYP